MADKEFLIDSVKDLIKQIRDRQKVANDLITELQAGGKAKKVPLKFKNKPALTSAKFILGKLKAAETALDSGCGDNQLAAPYVVTVSKEKGKSGKGH